MNERYEAKRDPYSDDERDWVVWDNKTWAMPFQATRRECAVIARELNGGATYASAEIAANP